MNDNLLRLEAVAALDPPCAVRTVERHIQRGIGPEIVWVEGRRKVTREAAERYKATLRHRG